MNIFFGERQRNKMSRHIIKYGGKSYEQKCSGMIISTGVGSTGWLHSAQDKLGTWSPTEKYFGFAATEIYKSTNLDFGFANKGEELIISSLNDDHGIVSIDSWQEMDFNMGSEAKVFIEEPLKVLIPL